VTVNWTRFHPHLVFEQKLNDNLDFRWKAPCIKKSSAQYFSPHSQELQKQNDLSELLLSLEKGSCRLFPYDTEIKQIRRVSKVLCQFGSSQLHLQRAVLVISTNNAPSLSELLAFNLTA
jgi:hypothetical protein